MPDKLIPTITQADNPDDWNRYTRAIIAALLNHLLDDGAKYLIDGKPGQPRKLVVPLKDMVSIQQATHLGVLALTVETDMKNNTVIFQPIIMDAGGTIP